MVLITEFWVSGHARTKGSLEHVGNGRLKDKDSSYAWRRLVVERVHADMNKRHGGVTTYAGPVMLELVTFLQCTRKNADPREWLMSEHAGDADKLERNVFDALQDSKAIVNDGQILYVVARKRLAHDGMMPGQQARLWGGTHEEWEW